MSEIDTCGESDLCTTGLPSALRLGSVRNSPIECSKYAAEKIHDVNCAKWLAHGNLIIKLSAVVAASSEFGALTVFRARSRPDIFPL